MAEKKKKYPKKKPGLHPRNKHQGRYDFKLLIKSCPELAQFVIVNKYKDESIDFFDPKAVRTLNRALLKRYYAIDKWDIPEGYLSPPIPGRADYIHHMADLLFEGSPDMLSLKSQATNPIKCLDIGMGASCIYPIIGVSEYGWSFVGSDIDMDSIESATKIINANPDLHGKIELRVQKSANDIFFGIIKPEEHFDLTICNPPFHASLAEAQAATQRKLNNLKHKKNIRPVLNFGGAHRELSYRGGERRFVRKMIRQSKQFATSCYWFSSLLSKESNLDSIYKELRREEAIKVKILPMGHGNKKSRIVAWTFLLPEQQEEWKKTRWQENV